RQMHLGRYAYATHRPTIRVREPEHDLVVVHGQAVTSDELGVELARQRRVSAQVPHPRIHRLIGQYLTTQRSLVILVDDSSISQRRGNTMSTIEQQTTEVPTGTWNADPVHSAVGFRVKHMAVGSFKGRFA